MFYQGLWSCQANQSRRTEGAPRPGLWWAGLDVPSRWGVYGRHRQLGILEGLDDGRERLADLSGETETYDGSAWLGTSGVWWGGRGERGRQATQTEDGVHDVIS